MSVNFYEQEIVGMNREDAAEDLMGKIIKQFEKLNCHISITKWNWKNGRFIFRIKPRSNTRETHIRANAEDVKLRLKLPLFRLLRGDNCLLLVVATEKPKYQPLLTTLSDPEVVKWMDRRQLPYVVGHDALGGLCLYDLAESPHLLLGGSTNSGKSVGLQALITGIAVSKSPSEVNFVLIDVGASNLMAFKALPHLSCPIVRSKENAVQVLISLMKEMERRIDLEYSNREEWMRLPRVVLVIDEFQALLGGGLSKDAVKCMTESISSILQRGRHGRIHVVLAAQNPTYHNMKVDLGNITGRAAFKCARKIYSLTIIDEGGAEKLAGHGEMLFRAPDSSTPSFVQGAYIDEKQIKETAKMIEKKWVNKDSSRFVIQIPSTSSLNPSRYKELKDSVKLSQNHGEDEMFAQVLLWVFSHDEVSQNAMMKQFCIGWSRSQEVMQKMTELGILSEKRAKLPRKVVPNSLSQLPDELINFMENNGVDRGTIAAAFMDRHGPEFSEKNGIQSLGIPKDKLDITDNLSEDKTKYKDEDKSVDGIDFAKSNMDKCSGRGLSDEKRTIKKLFSDIGPKRKEELQRQRKNRKKVTSKRSRFWDRIYLGNFAGAIALTLSKNYVSRRTIQSFLQKSSGEVDALIYRMEIWHIIARTDDGSQWKVLPGCLNELCDEAKEFLLEYGKTEEGLNAIFEGRTS